MRWRVGEGKRKAWGLGRGTVLTGSKKEEKQGSEWKAPKWGVHGRSERARGILLGKLSWLAVQMNLVAWGGGRGTGERGSNFHLS